MKTRFDLAVIGSGFGGSLLACIANRLGRSVVLLERDAHPRFVIGESSTPLADLLWLELTSRYGLRELGAFAKWGTWQRAYPEVACGLKRGFSFYHHPVGRENRTRASGTERPGLLVAASPRDEIADTHWYRPDFDHFLVRHAMGLGVEYQDRHEVTEVVRDAAGFTVRTRQGGEPRSFEARCVVDASNHRGPLVRSLKLEERVLPHFPATEGLYTHFTGVGRWESVQETENSLRSPPFPVDDAALHHVFDGGWIWVLRFNNGLTSAGVSARTETARRLRFEDGQAAWHRLLGELPEVAKQFENAEASRPFVHAPRLAFRTGPAGGDGWALLPSAAGFVDPLLSSGFTLTLLGIERLARALEQDPGSGEALASALAEHGRQTEAEFLALEHYLAALYACLGDPEAFTDIARLYFCAVIWCETTRRLGCPELAGGFLMHEHPVFGYRARRCCDAALHGLRGEALRREVDVAILDFDLAGLGDATRRPWYPVLANDLRASRHRLGVSEGEIERLLERAGWGG